MVMRVVAWLARAQAAVVARWRRARWAARVEPPAGTGGSLRDVFVLFIGGAKDKAPAAAMALQRLL